MLKSHHPKRLIILSILSMFMMLFSFSTQSVLAISPELKRLFKSGVHYFEPNGNSSDQCLTAPSTAQNNTSTNSTNAILAFAHQPLTSTWNVPNAVVENWFLEHSATNNAISRFGITADNIGEITSAIEAAGVSPVFFYAYSVEEGGRWGFINHFSSDTTGGGVANAKRDAEYLVSQANKTSDNPAWIDVGNYKDFVPIDVKNAGNADFKNMPTGTIGRAYIPATAATTWEVYYPNGLKSEFNGVQNYGAPLKDIMGYITKMGGDPSQGGALMSAGGCGAGSATTVSGDGKKLTLPSGGYGHEVFYYNQGDSKWKDQPAADNYDFSFCGCGMTSAAMVEASLSNNVNVTPVSIFKGLADAGAVAKNSYKRPNCGGTIVGGIINYFNSKKSEGFQAQTIQSHSLSQNLNTTKVAEQLKAGHLIIAHTSKWISYTNKMGTSGHYVVIYGMDDTGNNFYVANPADSGSDNGKPIPAEGISEWLDGAYAVWK